MNATKILCTLGPATDPPGIVEALARAGMDGARINFSHGGKDAQAPRVQAVREAEQALGRPLAVLADLQGPKIRIGRFPDGPVTLREGETITIVPGDGPCDQTHLTVDYPDLATGAEPGRDIYLADGFLHLRIEKVEGDQVTAVVLRGGPLSDRKGVNLPGTDLKLPTLTDRDLRDASDAVDLGCDFIALSFVRKADDIVALRDHLQKSGAAIPLIAKLERPEALDNLDAILEAADGVMVARGDLGVEVGMHKVPGLQKHILARAQAAGKTAIVATQMLESMTTNPLPTRAEVSDVANAIVDGADVVMLSGETAAGQFPVETVTMMQTISREARDLTCPTVELETHDHDQVAAAVVGGVMAMIDKIAPVAVAAFTQSGFTARLLAKRRPPVPVAALAPVEAVRRRCALYYGCIPLAIPDARGADEMMKLTDKMMLAHDLARPGERVLIVAGLPAGGSGTTNLIKVHKVQAP